MHWSFTTGITHKNDVESKLYSSMDAAVANADDAVKVRMVDQYTQASACAIRLLETVHGDHVNVTIYGHANLTSEPELGVSKDTVSVSVTQVE